MENYIVLETIGSGSFGKVTKVQRKSDNKILVWKEMAYGSMSEKEKQLLVSEVNILRELKHPHIVRYYDRILDRDNKKIYIIMEYCERGDLAQLIKRLAANNSNNASSQFPANEANKPLNSISNSCANSAGNIHQVSNQSSNSARFNDEETAWRVLLQMCLALKECHSPRNQDPASSPTTSSGRILHRDIKPGNIFLDEFNNCKLGDFGLARVLSSNSVFATTNVGTPLYMSPEQISEQAYDEKSDIWSLGCVIYELCTLSPPFQATNHVALAIKIKKGVYKPIPANLFSADLISVVVSMLQIDVSGFILLFLLLLFNSLNTNQKAKQASECRRVALSSIYRFEAS